MRHTQGRGNMPHCYRCTIKGGEHKVSQYLGTMNRRSLERISLNGRQDMDNQTHLTIRAARLMIMVL